MNTHSIHLIGIGPHVAKLGSEVIPGDVLVWNFGYVSKVTRILGETAAFVTIEIIDNGKLYTRRLKKSRPVAYTTKVAL